MAKIEARLERIERLLTELYAAAAPKPLNVDETAAYIDTSKFHVYKLTSARRIPYYRPTGKQLFFRKSDLDAYLLRNRREAADEVEEQAASYVAAHPARPGRTRRAAKRRAETETAAGA